MSVQLDAIRGALNLMGVSAPTETKSNAVPTAKTRAALELLAQSSTEKLVADRVDLKKVAQDLFDWSGKPKATKMVVRGLLKALNTENKYSQAVELTAYVAALAPLMEPDRLARLFDAIDEVETSYAPAKYTIQLSHKLKRLLEQYPEERREKLAYSLWVQSHKGRWWDLTAGNTEAPAVDDAQNHISNSELLRLFTERKLPWTPANANQLSKTKNVNAVLTALEEYNSDLAHERIVDPDTAVLSSHIQWLAPLERPESPIGSLLESLNELVTNIDYEMPEKPKSFSELFPDITLYGGTAFPFPTSILATDGKMLMPTVRLEVVQNATVLENNRTYMGNCTWSYKNRMEQGNYVLYRLHHGEEIYNGSIIKDVKGSWRKGELNSRFNRSQVPADVHAAFNNFIKTLPVAVADNAATKQMALNANIEKFQNHRYKFKI